MSFAIKIFLDSKPTSASRYVTLYYSREVGRDFQSVTIRLCGGGGAVRDSHLFFRGSWNQRAPLKDVVRLKGEMQ